MSAEEMAKRWRGRLKGLRLTDLRYITATAVRALRVLGDTIEIPPELKYEYDAVVSSEMWHAYGGGTNELPKIKGTPSKEIEMSQGYPIPYDPRIDFPGQPSTLPRAPVPSVLTADIRLEQAREALVAAEREKVQADAHAEYLRRLEYDTDLCRATAVLLQAIRDFGPDTKPNAMLDKFRKELSALAGAYGYKIVSVGTQQAVLVRR